GVAAEEAAQSRPGSAVPLCDEIPGCAGSAGEIASGVKLSGERLQVVDLRIELSRNSAADRDPRRKLVSRPARDVVERELIAESTGGVQLAVVNLQRADPFSEPAQPGRLPRCAIPARDVMGNDAAGSLECSADEEFTVEDRHVINELALKTAINAVVWRPQRRPC